MDALTTTRDEGCCNWLTSRREKMLVGGLLAITFALAAGSAAQKSVTVDEYQALPHGLAIWRTGDFHLATGVPMLPSVLPALPLLAVGAPLDTTEMPQYTSSWQCGLAFLVENAFERDPQTGQFLAPGHYHDYFLLGRLVSVGTLLLTCGLVFGFARSLYGREAGLLALGVACFSPNLLAHGRLVTPDVYLAAATIGCLWAYDRLALRPTWRWATLVGVCLGLASLSKLTGLLLFPLLPLCSVLAWASDWFGERCSSRGRHVSPQGRGPRNWPFLLGALAVGVLAINAGYLFDGTLTPLDRFKFESGQMQRLSRALPGWLPIPLPRYFFQGIDAQLAESDYTAYLMGKFNSTGFYSYYLVALAVKTPVPTLLLYALAWFCRGWPTRREWPLVFVAFLLLIFFSVARHKNIGVRYVLFLEPMMAVWIGRLWAARRGGRVDETNSKKTLPRWRCGLVSVNSVVLGSVICLAAIAMTSWPHYLPYFNWLSGGPNHGHRWLLDSNLDWGQDLIALRRYLDREQIAEIDLAHFGRVPPEVYGIRYRTLQAGERPRQRYVAISANLLWGLMYIVNGDLNYWPEDKDGYRAFRSLRPKAILGHSIYVYDLGEEAARLRGSPLHDDSPPGE